MKILVGLLEYAGLAAALVGVGCGIRGWWPDVIGCASLMVACAALAAVWRPTE